ncbi:hypothetical protein DID88_005202 [Monilinia fructigena]|uniref:FAD-dependent urate hydroxylase HpyO/Asp monooxygenase CreE-like FAD/NAD(P)-binding domain-containing protein n=1 Tax=Monilinia fructigena TaxID=38457 RepID=A0A395IDN6_9HELO|nr:hypothetical protein DID88_005202 [Monilinia fructigena]
MTSYGYSGRQAGEIVYGPQIAIVGAGPRGTSVLERISASASQFIHKDSWLTIHIIIDQYPPGAGKVWRTDQSPLLLMNTLASQTTLFTDDSVKCRGPIKNGSNLYEWLHRNEHPVNLNDYATRVQGGTYLRWVYDHVIERLPENVRVKFHLAQAQKLCKNTDDLYKVTLSTGKVIDTLSTVILAQDICPKILLMTTTWSPEQLHRPQIITQERIRAFRHEAKNNNAATFHTGLWPLIAKEVEIVYYKQLLRLRDESDEDIENFETEFLCGRDEDKVALIGRWNLELWNWEHVRHPDRQFRHQNCNEWEEKILSYLKEDVRQAQLGNIQGPHAAARSVLRDIRNELRRVIDHQGVKDDAERHLTRRFASLDGFLAVGPPLMRIEQMIALIDAGVLHVLSPKAAISESDDGKWSVVHRYPQETKHYKGAIKIIADGQIPANNQAPADDEAHSDDEAPANNEVNERVFAIGVPTEGALWSTTYLPTPNAGSE